MANEKVEEVLAQKELAVKERYARLIDVISALSAAESTEDEHRLAASLNSVLVEFQSQRRPRGDNRFFFRYKDGSNVLEDDGKSTRYFTTTSEAMDWFKLFTAAKASVEDYTLHSEKDLSIPPHV